MTHPPINLISHFAECNRIFFVRLQKWNWHFSAVEFRQWYEWVIDLSQYSIISFRRVICSSCVGSLAIEPLHSMVWGWFIVCLHVLQSDTPCINEDTKRKILNLLLIKINYIYSYETSYTALSATKHISNFALTIKTSKFKISPKKYIIIIIIHNLVNKESKSSKMFEWINFRSILIWFYK